MLFGLYNYKKKGDFTKKNTFFLENLFVLEKGCLHFFLSQLILVAYLADWEKM